MEASGDRHLFDALNRWLGARLALVAPPHIDASSMMFTMTMMGVHGLPPEVLAAHSDAAREVVISETDRADLSFSQDFVAQDAITLEALSERGVFIVPDVSAGGRIHHVYAEQTVRDMVRLRGPLSPFSRQRLDPETDFAYVPDALWRAQ